MSLSFAPWTVLAFPYNSLNWENSFGLRLPTTDWNLTCTDPPGGGQTRTLTSSMIRAAQGKRKPGPQGAGWYTP